MMPTDKIYYHGSNSNFSDGLNSATKGAGALEMKCILLNSQQLYYSMLMV